jgi:hypothetical protein
VPILQVHLYRGLVQEEHAAMLDQILDQMLEQMIMQMIMHI